MTQHARGAGEPPIELAAQLAPIGLRDGVSGLDAQVEVAVRDGGPFSLGASPTNLAAGDDGADDLGHPGHERVLGWAGTEGTRVHERFEVAVGARHGAATRPRLRRRGRSMSTPGVCGEKVATGAAPARVASSAIEAST